MANVPWLLTRLPNELLNAVFSYIGDDLETLDRLCVASQGDIRLQEASLSRRWQKTILDDYDLLPIPGEKETLELRSELERRGLTNKWKPTGHGVSALLAEARPGCYPANYVQELVINLQLYRQHYEDGIKRISPPTGVLTSTISWFQYSLQLLAPHLNNIQKIRYCGELPQTILDAILGFQKAAQIRSLILQECSVRPREPTSSSRRGFMVPEHRPLLDYVNLRQFDRLRSLEIHRLAHAEVPVFCALLPSLSWLEVLLTGDEPMDWRNGHGNPAGCGIRVFLESIIYGQEDASEDIYTNSDKKSGFPPRLESLTLIDRHKWQSFAEAQPRVLVNVDTPFTALHLDIDGLGYISSLVQCLKVAELRTLTLPASIIPYQESNHSDDIHDVVSAHQTTLKEIKLLQAWTVASDFAERFNARWQEKFSIQELVLGSPSYKWTSMQYLHRGQQQPSPLLTFYLGAYDGSTSAENPEQWGSQLQRIRIHFIELWNLDTTILNQPRFAKLRILMLQSYDDGSISGEERSKTSSIYEQIDNGTAQHLANSIMNNASSSLRVIVLQNYWWWVSTECKADRESRLWRWADAEKDPQEVTSMRKSLSEADWSFLHAMTSPLRNGIYRMEGERPLELPWHSHSLRDIRHQWNFMVALPIGG